MPKNLHLSVELAPVWQHQGPTEFRAHLRVIRGDIETEELMRGRFALNVCTGSAEVSLRPTVQQAMSLAAMLVQMAQAVEAEEAAAQARSMGVAA